MPINLIDPESIDLYLEDFLPSDPVAATHLKVALSKLLAHRPENARELRELPGDAPDWLKKKWPEGGPYHQFASDRDLDDRVRHIADWLKVAVQEDEPWLHQLETNGQPKRLLHLKGLKEAVEEADRDMRERNKRLAAQLGTDTEGEETVAAMADGYRVVKLTTTSALDREGVAMGHCIGQGAYDQFLHNGTREYFSLRDRNNKPHVTIEVDLAIDAVVQCKGKGNAPPTAKYLPYLGTFLRSKALQIAVPAYCCGLCQDTKGIIHSIFDLPDGLEVTGPLDLRSTPITQLPEGLHVGGPLHLYDTPITQLPDGLHVGGSLYLRGTSITQLPDGLQVGGDLDLFGTPIKQLPKGLTVGGDLNLTATQVSEIPSDAIVNGNVIGLRTHAQQVAERRNMGSALRDFS